MLYAREGADVAIVYLPEEQSDAVVFFASEADSSYITGEVLTLALRRDGRRLNVSPRRGLRAKFLT